LRLGDATDNKQSFKVYFHHFLSHGVEIGTFTLNYYQGLWKMVQRSMSGGISPNYS